MKKHIIYVIVLAAVVACLGITAFAEDEVAPVATTYTEIEKNYEYNFSGNNTVHGWATAIYQKGYLLWGARSWTEVWGDHGEAVADQTPYAFTRIRNQNTGDNKYVSNTVMDSNRYCGACTERIEEKYATYIYHKAYLKVNGVYDFNCEEYGS